MYLAQISIEDFRIFGSKADKQHLDLTLNPGLNVLAGENDSGKSAIIEAIRLALGTTSHDYIRITEDDFHIGKSGRAKDFRISCRFEGLSTAEGGRFLEWLTFEKPHPV